MSTVAALPEAPANPEPMQKLRVKWYRCPVPREELAKLNRRSDFKGFVQTCGYLGILATSGTAAVYSASHWPWYATVAILYFHGMCWNFMVNGFHELIHDSVFKTRWLNSLFLYVLSFLGWFNPFHFWASHMEHHKYTLHAPDDLEVVLPQRASIWGFLKTGVVNLNGPRSTLVNVTKSAMGIVKGEWNEHLFPASKKAERRQLAGWSWLLLIGHGLIFAVSIYMHWWMVPVVTSLAPFYGGLVQALCNASQHIGLVDRTPDYRLCCRTIYLNPFFRFLYWNMNYHTEHHMYAAVPCYNLPKLHELIKHDMPECPNGLVATWHQISSILFMQKLDPTYQYAPALPSPSPHAGKTVIPGRLQADEQFDEVEDDDPQHGHHSQ
jgi:fatty acid desaturase